MWNYPPTYFPWIVHMIIWERMGTVLLIIIIIMLIKTVFSHFIFLFLSIKQDVAMGFSLPKQTLLNFLFYESDLRRQELRIFVVRSTFISWLCMSLWKAIFDAIKCLQDNLTILHLFMKWAKLSIPDLPNQDQCSFYQKNHVLRT